MSEPLRVVSMGGGNGLSRLLSGLRCHAHFRENEPWVDITAVVAVSDDGGSSGRLRREFDVLPPGDIRNCMVALSEDSALLSRLFQYRFQAGHGLKGHSFGNLFLTALTGITGDFTAAVRNSSEVLKIAGNIYPATRANVVLEAELVNGRIVRGETRISRSRAPIRQIRMVPAQARPLAETLAAIAKADLITFGPGSLFTSVIPNLLVRGIPAAIRRSGALKACFLNLMSQPGETSDLRASDHLAALFNHAGAGIVDVAVANSSRVSPGLRARYAVKRAAPVETDADAIRKLGVELIEAPMLLREASNGKNGNKIRHDPAAVARVVLDLARRGRAGKTIAPVARALR